MEVSIKHKAMRDSIKMGPFVRIYLKDWRGMFGVRSDGTEELLWEDRVQQTGYCETCASEESGLRCILLPKNYQEDCLTNYEIFIE